MLFFDHRMSVVGKVVKNMKGLTTYKWARKFGVFIAVAAMVAFALSFSPSAFASEISHNGGEFDDTIDDLVALAIIDSVINDGLISGEMGGGKGEGMMNGNNFSDAFDSIVGLAIVDEVLDDGINNINGGNGGEFDDTIDDLVALAIIDSVINDGLINGENGAQHNTFSDAFDDIVALAIIDEVLNNGTDNGL